MSENLKTVIELPKFDTGQYEDSAFLMAKGGALLTINIAEMNSIKIAFTRVRWHEFTALYNCSSEQIDSAYFKLAEILPSESLARYVAGDRAPKNAYSTLHHYRIFLDETGCHEIYAEHARLTDSDS